MPDTPDTVFHATRDPDGAHPLAAELPAVEAPKLTREQQAAEKERAAAAPQVADPHAKPVRRPKAVDHETDWSKLGEKEVPRHDRYADENTAYPTPERVVPSGPTNANPTFADYAVLTQDRPGYADGSDAKDVAEATGSKPRAPKLTEEEPDGPVAGEGAFVVRPPTREATGATSPIGDAHNDASGARVADTKDEADAFFAKREEEKERAIAEGLAQDTSAPEVNIEAGAAVPRTDAAESGKGITSTASRRGRAKAE